MEKMNRNAANKGKNAIRAILMTLVLVGQVACESGGGSGDSSGSDDGGSPLVPPAPIEVTIDLKTGRDFECFALADVVYCRGVASNPSIALNTATFIAYAEDSDSSIISLELWDDTICWSSSVAQRPFSNGPGVATYCTGEATLAGYDTTSMVYAGPNFSSAANGSSDMAYAAEPFVGGDITMATLVNNPWVTDGSSFVSSSSLVCEKSADGSTLTCPSFVVNL